MKERNQTSKSPGVLAELGGDRTPTPRQMRFFAGFIRTLERMQWKRLRYS